MRNLLIAISFLFLAGCSFLPAKHDSMLFYDMVNVDLQIEHIDCTDTSGRSRKIFSAVEFQWHGVWYKMMTIVRYAEWRHDSQLDNLIGLLNHAKKMSTQGAVTSTTFCELTKKTARERIKAVHRAWEGRE